MPILLAILLTTATNLLIIFLAILTSHGSLFTPTPLPLIAQFAILGIGIFQLIYIVPLVIWLYRRQQYAWMKGFIIGAALTLLCNGGCYLVLTGSLR